MTYGSVARLKARSVPTSLAAPVGADLRDVIDIVRSEGIESAQIARSSRILGEVALQIDLHALGLSDPGFDPSSPVFAALTSQHLARTLALHRENGASISARVVSTRHADHVLLDAGDEYALEILAQRLLSLGWTPSEDGEIEQASSAGREVRWDSTSVDAGVARLSGHVLDVAEKPSRSGRLIAMLDRITRPSQVLSGLPGGLLPDEAAQESARHAGASRAPEFVGAEEGLRDFHVEELISGPDAPSHRITRGELANLRSRIDHRYAREIIGVAPTI